jgi:membrane-bound lytic murein transglycosylase B
LFAHSEPAADFQGCLDGLETRAREAGVDRELLASVLPGLKPQERVISLDREQPEFVQTFPEYLSKRVTPQRVQRGRELLAEHSGYLEGLAQRYGVPAQYLVAFWGLETNYGGYLGRMPTLDSLATLACDERRSDFFAAEFVAAMQLLEREDLQPEAMQGSWAGAVGHTQFMPSSYLRYAVDGDGDGKVDLWRSERDALASGANFLRSLGWQPGLRWGREVRVTDQAAYELALGRSDSRPLADWARVGVRRADGSALPAASVSAALILPAGHSGPAFLVYDNFEVILRWNRSESYALAVGHLADRIAGGGTLRADIDTLPALRRADIEQAQRVLNHLGYDAGPVDGILGSGTRQALRDLQRDNALIRDGYPSPETLEVIARHDMD